MIYISKRPSLFHAMLCALREQERFGCSKYEAKQAAIARAHAEGRTGFGVSPEGVYGVVTFATYRQIAHEFAAWAGKHGARTMEDAHPLVAEYLRKRIAAGKSAWTIQRDRSGLRKIFRDHQLAAEVAVPRRRITDIKRSRNSVKMDALFNEELHRDLVTFAKGTGLRRHELAAVTGQDVYEEDGNLIVWVKQGKGGKKRKVRVIRYLVGRVKETAQSADPEQPIFKKIPKAMDVHCYRSKYAQARLEESPEEEVTRDLGHIRTDVLRLHYMRRK